MSSQLLQEQFDSIMKSANCGYTVELVGGDLYRWKVIFEGPSNSPFEGGFFPAIMTFPGDFPNSPPQIKFACTIYHPNVSVDGTIQIGVLVTEPNDENYFETNDMHWDPQIMTVNYILMSIILMLCEPDLNMTAANPAAANDCISNKREYERKIRQAMRADSNHK